MYLENTEASALPTFSLKMYMGSDLSNSATQRLMDRYKKAVDNPPSQYESCLSLGLCCRQADLARWNCSWVWLFLSGSTGPPQENWVGSISGMFLWTEQTQVATGTQTHTPPHPNPWARKGHQITACYWPWHAIGCLKIALPLAREGETQKNLYLQSEHHLQSNRSWLATTWITSFPDGALSLPKDEIRPFSKQQKLPCYLENKTPHWHRQHSPNAVVNIF